ncbi:helix-turn-helix domain-containing protein [Streptomyces sp. NBC_01795]|nr:helix-turn-helix domain-containing protein [Streptomyces sp. NBC_01795]WSB78479.1 helix-turn-helix domain-containing protein [Streptomyces sp. NBC_01775]WSS13321.1 helix-turn-helix domain-containing protein [Streptomyces sp. NBC_01186]WSS42108.1 helix-turn-helix domain-containing protein [Streptomyces sp. NBC_01187]
MCEDRAMAVFTRPGLHRVAVLVRHGLLPIELGIPHALMGKAGSASEEPLYEVVTCAVRPGVIRTDGDFTINVDHGPEALAEADTVIVPAAHERDEPYVRGTMSPGLADAFARIRPVTRIASICTGAFVLASAGLLDGKRATTHWRSSKRFQRLFPDVRLDSDVLYVDEGSVLTSAGIASGVDLCLHMIRCDHGAAVANEVARRTVVPPHRDGGQAQFIRRPVPQPGLASTGTARAWALKQLERPITLRELAAQESMSIRTFTRRFREEAGISPQQWLTQQRTERARQLLEETGLSVDQIAQRAGFGSAATLRMHFQTALGVSPSAYRRTFRADANGSIRASAETGSIRRDAEGSGIRAGAGVNGGAEG